MTSSKNNRVRRNIYLWAIYW